MKVLLRLYPSDWRDRYSEELDDLVADCELSLADVFDLVRGAFDAWRHPINGKRQRKSKGRWYMNFTIREWSGVAIILGAALLTLVGLNPGYAFRGGAQCSTVPNCPPSPDWAFAVVVCPALALLLAGASSMWLDARFRGRENILGELSVLLTLAGFVLFVVGHGNEDVGGLGLFLILLSMIPHGIAAIIARVLPLWSAVLLVLAAPLATGFFGRFHTFLGTGPQALGLRPSLGVGLIFATLLLAGCTLLLGASAVRQ